MNALERFRERYPAVDLAQMTTAKGTLADNLGAANADIYWLDGDPVGVVVVHEGRGVFVPREQLKGAVHA
jgi:hypothetical protein